MHCEGDKTYNQPGDCPVCNMHLVPLEEKDESRRVTRLEVVYMTANTKLHKKKKGHSIIAP